MYEVKNLPEGWKAHKYAIILDCNNSTSPEWQGYWYGGLYDDLASASKDLKSVDNGIVVSTIDICEASQKVSTVEDELELLCQDMASHIKHLRDETYHPYDEEEQFVYRLRGIINKYF